MFTRFHVPGGKAIALAAMPTAVLMGMGFTPTLALADGNDGKLPANSLTLEEYQACLEVIEGAEKDDASASPTPSASASASASPEAEPSAETPGQQAPEADQGMDAGKDTDAGKGTSSSPDSGSDDKDEPAPAPSATEDTAEPEPTPSKTDRNLLEGLGDALEDVFTPKEKEAAASPAPSASATEEETQEKAEGTAGTAGETTEKATEAVEDTAEDVGDKASETTGDAEETVGETAGEEATEEAAAPEATASPSPSASATVDPEDCPVATDAEGGVDNELLLPDDPWTLNASALTLNDASYKGIVEVRTAGGATKRVLKYVISGGTDIVDLHQTVTDKRTGVTHHVQAAKGSKSTITDGDTVMYTESISGNLLGLIPITFDPEHPPPLDIPWIHFTKVTVKQAGQFGGTLHIPGLRQYITTG
ncbi:membrane-bound hydrophilic protein [Streptomyces caelestis]|uniref:Membrane-bound hydrophilic protein n=1 Tax=Streptomyces caelestis TaxID=36816 RepID=A0A0N0S5R4_9ACTN|nr:membrane-bound hydrophilic protein [Streptomyces caelestis]